MKIRKLEQEYEEIHNKIAAGKYKTGGVGLLLKDWRCSVFSIMLLIFYAKEYLKNIDK